MGIENRTLRESEIEGIIPHRKPFRFIDEITGMEVGKRAEGPLVDLAQAEFAWLHPQLQASGVVPLPLVMEAVAEVGAVAVLGMPENKGKIGVFAGAMMELTQGPIRVDEKIILSAEIGNLRSNFGRAKGQAFVNGELRAEGTVSFGIMDMPAA